MCNIEMIETLNYSITIHGAKNQWLSSKWSLLIVLFYFTALQADHTHDETSTAALYEGLTVENVRNADMILKVYFFLIWTRYLGKISD